MANSSSPLALLAAGLISACGASLARAPTRAVAAAPESSVVPQRAEDVASAERVGEALPREHDATPHGQSVPSDGELGAVPSERVERTVAGELTELDVEGDAPVVVIRGEASAPRVLIYLHGACGDIRAPRAWSRAAARVGTLVALRGDRACGKGERRYWGPSTLRLEQRIRKAVAAVASVRAELLDVSELVLIGYSQGATRAQALARAYPERYPLVVLAGIPVAPSARHLAKSRAVVVLGGELELTTHMKTGVWALEAHDIDVRFDVFPQARHGEFGPDGERVMADAFEWLSKR